MVKNKFSLLLLISGALLFLNSNIISNALAIILPPKRDPVFGTITKPQKNINRGIWVTVFSERKVLYSKEAVMDLVKVCKKARINEIYLQLYRAGQAYYDSQDTDPSKYEEIIKSAGADTIDLLLREARKNNIKVFAWVNMLSLAQNKKAPILARFGHQLLTRDQHLRISVRTEDINEYDKYYLRDDQLFLEPGDPRVVEYLVSIVDEIINRYPLISGIHLDYIRYPYPVPFIPRSRFNKYGLTYGYGEKNVKRFKEVSRLDPFLAQDNENISLKWDNWKRDQVTNLVERLSKRIKSKSGHLLVSCAVIPSPERAYSAAFQDWPLWLEKGIVDYVVLMNYTRDNRLAEVTAKSVLSHNTKGKIYIGIGAFLFNDNRGALLKQYEIINNLNPEGIVLFSYDDMSGEMLKMFKY